MTPDERARLRETHHVLTGGQPTTVHTWALGRVDKPDAEHLTALINAVPNLLDALDALTARRDALIDALRVYAEGHDDPSLAARALVTGTGVEGGGE